MNQRKLRYHRMKVKQSSRLGSRCREYMAGCVTCDGYRFLDENGRYPWSFDELQKYSQIQEKLHGD